MFGKNGLKAEAVLLAGVIAVGSTILTSDTASAASRENTYHRNNHSNEIDSSVGINVLTRPLGVAALGLVGAVLTEASAAPFDNSGMNAFKKGDYNKAIELFTKAINTDSEYFISYVHRAAAYYELGMYDAALRDVDECIAYGEHIYAEAYDIRAKIRRIKKEPLYTILIDYNNAIQIEPKNPKYYVDRARVNREMEREEKALADYNTAIKLTPKKEQGPIIDERDGIAPAVYDWEITDNSINDTENITADGVNLENVNEDINEQIDTSESQSIQDTTIIPTE